MLCLKTALINHFSELILHQLSSVVLRYCKENYSAYCILSCWTLNFCLSTRRLISFINFFKRCPRSLHWFMVTHMLGYKIYKKITTFSILNFLHILLHICILITSKRLNRNNWIKEIWTAFVFCCFFKYAKIILKVWRNHLVFAVN